MEQEPPADAAVYQRDGDRYVPAAIARGPWDPDAQHGGAPSALLARAVERHEPASDPVHALAVVRLTVELLRPVPLDPLTVRVRTIRPGRRVQLVEAGLFAGDTEVARATGLKLRVTPLPLPPRAVPDDRLAVGHDGEPLTLGPRRFDTSFADAMDIVPVVGELGRGGPGTAWFRLRVALVAGEEPSPLQRVAAAADFGNGISAAVDWDEGWLFVNPDLTVTLHRPPVGEWVALEAVTYPGELGAGLAEAALYDDVGRIGRSVQTLLLDRLDPA